MRHRVAAATSLRAFEPSGVRHLGRPPRRDHAARARSHTASAAAGTSASSATEIKTCPPRDGKALADLIPAMRVERAERVVHQEQGWFCRSPATTAEARPSRRHSAAAQVSPCDPNARAPRSRTASSRSSRCGPTREVRRCSSSPRRSLTRGTRPRLGRRPRIEVAVGPHVRPVGARELVAGEVRELLRSRAARVARRPRRAPLISGAAGRSRAPRPTPRSRRRGSPGRSHSFSRRLRCRSARS